MVFPAVTQNTHSCSSPAVQVCFFWLWAVNALWQLTIIFHRHTLSYPHSLPRQFPLAKLPLSFFHIFPIVFFFCFLLSSTIIRCFEMQNQPIARKHFFLFLFWCTSVGFDVSKSSFLRFYLSYLIFDTSVIHVSSRAMSYLCYYWIAALFNTFFISIFTHSIFSKKQYLASITATIALKCTVLSDLEMVGFPGMFFCQAMCLKILVKVFIVQRVI